MTEIPSRWKQLNDSIMETNNIFDGAYSRIIEDEAWQRISGDYPFSAEQLEQYKDRLDWHEVSGNRTGLARIVKVNAG